MISKLIITADSFGLTRDVSEAIVEAHVQGIVTSTSVFGNCDVTVFEAVQEVKRKHPKLGFGIQLVLTTRQPVLKTHKTLVNDLGNFSKENLSVDELDPNEVYDEWKAQIERVSEHFELTHLDSYQNIHCHPKLQKVSKRLSKEFKLPMRWNKAKKYAYVFGIQGFQKGVTTASFIEDLTAHHGLVDIRVQPGKPDDVFLAEISSYTDGRHQELEVLTDPELKAFIKKQNIRRVNYTYVRKKEATPKG